MSALRLLAIHSIRTAVQRCSAATAASRSVLLNQSSILSNNRYTNQFNRSISSNSNRNHSSNSSSVNAAEPEITGLNSRADVESRLLSVLYNHSKLSHHTPTINNVSTGAAAAAAVPAVNYSIPLTATMNELGLDSLDVVELLVQVEREFSIELPDEQYNSNNTVEQLIEYIIWHPQATLQRKIDGLK